MNDKFPSYFSSVSGRLHFVLAALFLVLFATGVGSVALSRRVADAAKVVQAQALSGERTADAFDSLLDTHRRTLASLAQQHAPAAFREGGEHLRHIMRELQSYAVPAADSGELDAPTAAAFREQLEQMAAAAADVVNGLAADNVAPAEASRRYTDAVNRLEESILDWKAEMRVAAAHQLAWLARRATVTRHAALTLTLIAGAIGAVALLLGTRVLRRFARLSSAMLALGAGRIDHAIPFQSDRDDIGMMARALGVFRDSVQRALISESRLNSAIENMPDGIVMWSSAGRIVLYNRKWRTIFHLPDRDYHGMTVADLRDVILEAAGRPPGSYDPAFEYLLEAHRTGENRQFDLEFADGRCMHIITNTLPDRGFLVTTEDISERRAAAATILHLTRHDPLTNLPNRGVFQERLAAAAQRAAHDPTCGVALLLCDLDHFNEINDTYGHPAGDELLTQVTRRLHDVLCQHDMLARLGSDEFAIVQLSAEQPGESMALAERLIEAMKPPFAIRGTQITIGLSVGVAIAPADATNSVDLLKRADMALYASKQHGRGTSVFYNPGMSIRLHERRELEADLHQAIEQQEFRLAYQPLVDLRSRRIVGFEALIRWPHPTRGPVAPASFIPVAEETGLIVPIGRWVLHTACADAASWGGEETVAVNVSSQQFILDDIVGTVRAALAETGLRPERLEIEITEGLMLSDGPDVLRMLTELRALGVRISVDDFGTGYSSLSYLHKFPIDKIKIDQSFVRNLGSTEESAAIVQAIASLGITLGIKILAEGIETEDQAIFVLRASCVEGQGYLFSRPVPAEEAARLLDLQAARQA